MSPVQILFAEDDDSIADLIELKLKRLGFSIVRTRDGSEAARLLADKARSGTPFDIALLDGRLPKRNGFEVMEEAVAFSWVSGGLLISADAYDPAQLPENWGALRKPFDLNTLVARVQQCVDAIALSTSDVTDDWERLSREFVASFTTRAEALERILGENDGFRRSELLDEFAHRFAGAAGLYQMKDLERLAAQIESEPDQKKKDEQGWLLVQHLRR